MLVGSPWYIFASPTSNNGIQKHNLAGCEYSRAASFLSLEKVLETPGLLGLHPIWSVDEAQNLALKVEREEGHQSNECPKWRQTLLTNFDVDIDEEIVAKEFDENVDEYADVEVMKGVEEEKANDVLKKVKPLL
ncbi:hypothetical protein L2E82_05963 [Cichorium intybus]|uniref:Uncharacterized protein n=1 Tax=Cichorium intybus TaxID=13427 RepID=A0ACB9H9U9_CICIN|nr:hypothetical protein L2E82_05963 [Cichorium intybus]